MAQEKPRTTRARTKKDTADTEASAKPAAKTRAKAPSAESKPKATKARPKAATSVTKPKTASRRKQPIAPVETEIATLAYLMWERGERGDATDHWLRAEAELRTAA